MDQRKQTCGLAPAYPHTRISDRRVGRRGLIIAEFKIITLRLEGVMIDILHALDLGVASHVCANIFVEVLSFWICFVLDLVLLSQVVVDPKSPKMLRCQGHRTEHRS